MKIAIVEDQQEDALLLSKKIKNYIDEYSLPCELSFYHCGEDFVEALSTLAFDIVFMDIYLSGMTGMEAAIILRQRDRDCKLIFLTSSDEYLRQGYSVDASHYLLKPVRDKEFREAMANCRLRPNYTVPTLDIFYKGAPFQLETGMITYISIENRVVQIHAKSHIFPVSGTFSKVTEPLRKDPRFLQVLRGIMLNMDYISHLEGSLFVLQNGEKIPINLRNRKRILQAYRDYVFRQLGGH